MTNETTIAPPRRPSPAPKSWARALLDRTRRWLAPGGAPGARKPGGKPGAEKKAGPKPETGKKPGAAKKAGGKPGAAPPRAEAPVSAPVSAPVAAASAAALAAPVALATPARRQGGGRRGPRPIPDFALIVGAMKSGTTSLFDYLVTHPEIAACRRKEPSFFAADRRGKIPRRYYRLWPDFDPARHRYALEASVDYTKQPRYGAVAARIAAFPARFKCIYIVRDPVDRIESHIAHNIGKGRVTAKDYAEMVPSALAISRYAHQLDAFRQGLGGEAEVLLLDFDELRRDPMALLGRVVAFLGIDPGFAFADRPPSNTRASKSAEFRLAPEERARFHAELAPDMALFAKHYGFDVARWGFTPEAYPEAFAAAAAAPARKPPPPRAAAKPAKKIEAPKKAAPAASARQGYWEQRRDLVYYDYVRTMVGRLGARAGSLIDVGSHKTSLAEEFAWIPERFTLDLREPYSSERVQGIQADFLAFEPGRRYDLATCFQVLEHVPEAEAFAKKLLAVSDRVLVSVPYRWPAGHNPSHVHDPVDGAKLAAWFGREPDYKILVQEPLRPGGRGRRLIAYYHNVPGEPFDPRRLPPPPEAGPEGADPAARRRGAGYWRKRRRMLYYAYVRTLVRAFAARSTRLIDVGSHQTSLVEEFDWIAERTALDIHRPYHSERVRGVKADFLTFEPEARYDFATCFQVLEHVPPAEAFARKLLAVADRVLISVPYRWPEGSHYDHAHDLVDEAKLAAWFGRAPDYQIVVREPFVGRGRARRLIAYYHNVPGEPFDLAKARAALPRGRAGA